MDDGVSNSLCCYTLLRPVVPPFRVNFLSRGGSARINILTRLSDATNGYQILAVIDKHIYNSSFFENIVTPKKIIMKFIINKPKIIWSGKIKLVEMRLIDNNISERII